MSATFLPAQLEHAIYPDTPAGPNGFKWEPPALRYRLFEQARMESVYHPAHPVRELWERFWEECSRIRVWSLPAEFGNMHVIDGAYVKTRIEHGGRSINVDAQLRQAPPDVIWTVIRLHAALQTLVGYAGPFPDPEEWIANMTFE